MIMLAVVFIDIVWMNAGMVGSFLLISTNIKFLGTGQSEENFVLGLVHIA